MKKNFISWNAPVFCKVDEWLQHWGRSPEGGQRNLDSQSSKFPLKHKEERAGRRGGLHTLGAREIVSVGVWLWKWGNKASICLRNLGFSSTKFSFQSSDFFKDGQGCVLKCVVTGLGTLTQARASCTCFLLCSPDIAICLVGCTLDRSPLRLPNRKTKLWSKKKKKKKMCLLVSGIVINNCLSACRRST